LSRAGKPFERVHCATLDTGELADSQLFGYEPGAHSMARGRFIGAIERTEDGTFLLDDVDYLPVRVQVKLLQPLEERILRRLPGSVEVRVRCRVIATTNKDLAAMAAAGTFRSDLLSRLGGGQTIRVPGIGERKEDLPGLVDIFARQVAAETGIRLEPIPETFRRAVLERRRQDVRELGNAIRYAVGVCSSGVLHPDDLAGPSGRGPGVGSQGDPTGSGAGSDLLLSGSLERILDRTRAAAVQLALARHGGDKRAAAADLQITVQWLNTILRQPETGKNGESTAPQ
jgi:DNA-binding NtrC family response regulator